MVDALSRLQSTGRFALELEAVSRHFGALVALADINLTDKHGQEAFWQYGQQRKPQICVMAPMCRSFGGRSRINRQLHPETWQQSLDETLELGRFCGRVALVQYHRQRDWLNEQPSASDLYNHDPWPNVAAHPQTVVARFHQCQFGAKTVRGERI